MDQALGLERLRTEYARASGTDLADDIMLSILVRSLPKHIQQHIQLQMDESSTYSKVRELVLGYEAVTTSWTPAKIHNELGVIPHAGALNASPGQPYNGPMPMEVDRFEKGKQKGKSKGKQKGKDKGKGKGKFDKGKGKSSSESGKTRAATANDKRLYCNKYGHFKRDCWKLHGRPGQTKNVNQVAEEGQTQAAGSSASSLAGGSSAAPASASSVRLFTSYAGPIIEEVFDDDDVEIRDLTQYDSFSGSISMVSQAHFAPSDDAAADVEAYMCGSQRRMVS